jgi:hypothetical protein
MKDIPINFIPKVENYIFCGTVRARTFRTPLKFIKKQNFHEIKRKNSQNSQYKPKNQWKILRQHDSCLIQPSKAINKNTK